MKRLLIVNLIFLGMNNLFGQKLFYQNKYALIKDGKMVEVKVQDSTYNIYGGYVSPKGSYVSGFLIKGKLKKVLDDVREKNEVLYKSPDGIETFVIYSCADDSVVLYGDTSKYFPGKVMFSEDEKYVLLSAWENSKLINLQNGELLYEFPRGCKEGFKGFKWIGDNLYFLYGGSNSIKHIFGYYDKKEKKVKDVFSIFKEETYKNFDDYSFEIVDSSRILFKYKTEEGTWLKLIDGKSISTLVGFNYLYIQDIYEENILFFAKGSKHDERGLYLLNINTLSISRLFDGGDILHDLPDSLYLECLFPFKFKDNVYFISGIVPGFENIIKYNILEDKFSLVTEGGYISAPIGYYEE